ncbi:ANR26 protein, partial [Casuarius casuarius]|nr:ANR26 protein [Casuarius casuarius]
LCRFKGLLKTAMKKVRVYEMLRECKSQFSSQGEMKNRYSEIVNEVSRLRTKVRKLSHWLATERRKSRQLEKANEGLREELAWLHGSRDKLRKRKRHLEEEVVVLRRHLEAKMMDHSQFSRGTAAWTFCSGCLFSLGVTFLFSFRFLKLHYVLQMQAAFQDRLEQRSASHHASLRNQIKYRIRDLESELVRIKNTQQDSIFQKNPHRQKWESHLAGAKIRRCLANELER